jgi:hypothetical protein
MKAQAQLVQQGRLRKMGRLNYLPTRLLLLLLLSSFATSEAATTIRAAQNGRPGFLFTRTRGRCTPQ